MSVFLDAREERTVFETEHFFVFKDNFPVSPGHMLIISKRDARDYFDLNLLEQQDLPVAIKSCREYIELNHAPDGYNIGMNCGFAAGQTVFHFHCHIWPRFKGDVIDPRGGVRNCMPNGNYMKNLPNF